MTEHLQPPSATALQRAVSQVLASATTLPVELRGLWAPDTCPAHLLPWLAWAFGVEQWDSRWSVRRQRAAIRASLPIKRRKGTASAVLSAIQALDLQVQMHEWQHQTPVGEPYTFDLYVTVDQSGLDRGDYTRLLGSVNAAKNARSHLDSLVVQVDSPATTHMAAATLLGVELTIGATPLPPPGS